MQHFKAAIANAWRHQVSAELGVRIEFQHGASFGCTRISAASSLVPFSGERDKALLRSILVLCVWNGFVLRKVRAWWILAVVVVVLMAMGIFSGNVLVLL